MQIELTALKQWLLGTVTGVVLLGALGSILGSILFLLLRRIFREVKRAWGKSLIAIAYRQFGRDVEIGDQLRGRYDAEARSSAYVLFVIGELAGFVLDVVVAVVAVAGTIGIAVVYRLDRPILLVVAISISIPLALHCMRSAAFLASLMDESVGRVREEIEASQPKRYRDWIALKDSLSHRCNREDR